MKRFVATIVCIVSVFFAAPASAQQWRGLTLDPQTIIRPQLLSQALASYQAHQAEHLKGDTIAIVDFSKPSSQRRLYMLDLRTGAVQSLLVAHGQGSDRDQDGIAEIFSNSDGSHASAIGAYRAAAPYQGGHGLSLALDGLDPTNRSARARAIVLHSQWYVSDRIVRERGKLGRSWGCFVVDAAVLSGVVQRLEDGGFIYAGR